MGHYPIQYYSDLYDLFEFTCKTRKLVSVIYAADLQKNPEKVMQMEKYCADTGLPYDKKVLTLTPGVVEDWAVSPSCNDWHWIEG